jgi:hypothetical protein
MKNQYVYIIADQQGIPFQDVAFSRSEARQYKRQYEQMTAEKLKIVRFTVDKKVR